MSHANHGEEKHVDGGVAPFCIQCFSYSNTAASALSPAHTTTPSSALCNEALQGLCGLYTNIVQSSSTSRHAFLATLLKPLDRATDLHSTADVLAADPQQLRFIVQLLFALPLRRGDEGMSVLQPVHTLLWTRGEVTLDALKTALQGVGAGQQDGGGEGGQHGGGEGGNAVAGAPQALPEDAQVCLLLGLLCLGMQHAPLQKKHYHTPPCLV